MQRTPNPDVNSPNVGDEGGNQNTTDVEPTRSDKEDMPVPPNRPPTVPIEEPPEVKDQPPVEEDEIEPKRIV
jgi:hypothetical protein